MVGRSRISSEESSLSIEADMLYISAQKGKSGL